VQRQQRELEIDRGSELRLLLAQLRQLGDFTRCRASGTCGPLSSGHEQIVMERGRKSAGPGPTGRAPVDI
jgi:hypothetical protein